MASSGERQVSSAGLGPPVVSVSAQVIMASVPGQKIVDLGSHLSSTQNYVFQSATFSFASKKVKISIFRYLSA